MTDQHCNSPGPGGSCHMRKGHTGNHRNEAGQAWPARIVVTLTREEAIALYVAAGFGKPRTKLAIDEEGGHYERAVEKVNLALTNGRS